MASSSSSALIQPTTRSRTLLYISYRDSRTRSTRFSRARPTTYDDAYTGGEDEHEGLMTSSSNPGHVSIDVDPLPPKWVDLSEQVEDILAGTQAKMKMLDKLHAKHVLPGFTDRSAEEREIEAVTTDITKDFRQCQTLITRIGSIPHTFPPGPQSDQQQRSRHETLAAKNIQRGLAAKVQDLSASFRKRQRVYMEKLQGHAIKNQDLLIASGTISLKGSDSLSALDDDVAAAHNQSHNHQYQTQASLQADPNTEIIRTRDHELTEIAKSIEQLAELFKDLSVLVIDQGTLLDSVEYNIEQTAVQMEEAVKELKIATTYQKNTGRRKCIFLLLLIIFGLIVVLIFKPRRHDTPPPPTTNPRSLVVRARTF